jgi:hypothetical protein
VCEWSAELMAVGLTGDSTGAAEMSPKGGSWILRLKQACPLSVSPLLLNQLACESARGRFASIVWPRLASRRDGSWSRLQSIRFLH